MTALIYFPDQYRDELLYSLLARYHRHGGNPNVSATNLELFGKRHIRTSFDLPSYLSTLAGRVHVARGLTPERLSREGTHMPYYAAFMSAERRAEALIKQVDGYPSLHIWMGVNTFVIPPVRRLHFCRDCCREMLDQRGELWWKRSHHLPGVLVCPEHGVSLSVSPATTWTRGQNGFVAATPATCPDDAEELVSGASDAVMARLRDVAERSAALLHSPGEIQSYAEAGREYRERLFDLGLMRSRSQIDVAALIDRFRTFHGGALALLPGVLDVEGRFDRWLVELVRTGRKGTHPLQHILLRSFLDAQGERTPPFGRGPWRCPNPMAGHGDALTIVHVVEKRSDQCVIGTFECPCGYAYTMSRGDDGRLRGPRFKKFGPLLDPALIKLVGEGATLRGAAAALGIHPRAIAAAATRLNLGTSWTPPAKMGDRIGRPEAPPKAARKPQARECRIRENRVERVNWAEVDTALASEVEAAAARLLQARPPVMVRMRSIEMELARPSYIFVRRSKLPKTIEAVGRVSESFEEFQRRRISCALGDARMKGRVNVSGVMRAAGVKPVWKAYVQELVSAVPGR